MKYTSAALLGFLLFAQTGASAMDVDLVSGDLKVLKGEKALKVEYVYPEDMRVGKGSEKEYVAEKKAEFETKEAGKGAKFERNWFDARASRYQPKFETLMNRILEDRKVSLRVAPDARDAKYTLIVTTTMTEPGWNAAIMRAPAYINADLNLVETANPQNVVAKIRVLKSPGRDAWGVDFDPATRIEEAYAKCGKEVANLLFKKGLK